MLLQKRDAYRLRKLVLTLGAFALRESRSPEGANLGRQWEPQHLRAIDQLIWVQEGGLAYIDRFVDENPGRVARIDLAQVASWRQALHADFVLVRVDAETYLTQGSHVFAVRGITEELFDLVHDTPCPLTTTLLPFAGIITNNSVAESFDVSFDAESVAAVQRLVHEHVESRRAIRSAKGFLACVDEARRTVLSFDPSPTTPDTIRLRAVTDTSQGARQEDAL